MVGPGIPQGLRYEFFPATNMLLSWDKLVGIDGYNCYIYEGATWVKINTTLIPPRKWSYAHFQSLYTSQNDDFLGDDKHSWDPIKEGGINLLGDKSYTFAITSVLGMSESDKSNWVTWHPTRHEGGVENLLPPIEGTWDIGAATFVLDTHYGVNKKIVKITMEFTTAVHKIVYIRSVSPGGSRVIIVREDGAGTYYPPVGDYLTITDEMVMSADCELQIEVPTVGPSACSVRYRIEAMQI